MSRILATASAALAAGLVFAPSAFAFDCAKAATPVEKAICDDPALKAADDAMGAAYADVARRVSAEQKPMLKGNQLAWLKRRDEMCMWQDGPARTECLLNETNQRADFLRALAAPVARGGQAARQLRVIGVEPQAHDMYRGIDKGDRDLHAREVVHAQCLGRRRGTVLAADLVVIGQRPQLHAVAMGARGQCLGRERAVGDDGMAMQVGVEQMRHQGIVGCAPGPRRRSDLRDKAGKNMCLLP